jgi:phospholipase C
VGYSPEQMAFDGGKMDLFPLNIGAGGNALGNPVTNEPAAVNTNGLVMAYFATGCCARMDNSTIPFR